MVQYKSYKTVEWLVWMSYDLMHTRNLEFNCLAVAMYCSVLFSSLLCGVGQWKRGQCLKMENKSSFETSASRRGGNRGKNNNWVTCRQGRRSSTNPPADKTLSPSSESCHGDVVNLWIRAKTGRKESCSINSNWTAVTVTFLIGKSMRGCYGSLLAWISFFRSILIGGPLKTFVRIHTKSLVIQFYVQWFWFLLDLSISSLTYFWTAF